MVTNGTGSTVPLEILPAGEFDPQYRIPLEVGSGELPVLPLSIYGAVAMARAPDVAGEGMLAGDEFFVFKFTREQAGLSGLSFDEGTFGVFGYVTKVCAVANASSPSHPPSALRAAYGCNPSFLSSRVKSSDCACAHRHFPSVHLVFCSLGKWFS